MHTIDDFVFGFRFFAFFVVFFLIVVQPNSTNLGSQSAATNFNKCRRIQNDIFAS